MFIYLINHIKEISELFGFILVLLNIGNLVRKPIISIFNKLFPVKYNFNIQNSKGLCIGRKKEKKQLYKNILHKKSTIIYGGPAVGKTIVTVKTLNSINQRTLKRLYPDGTISYDFYEDSSPDTAIKRLYNKIITEDNKNIDFDVVLNKKKCLIYLEGCERTSGMDKIVRLCSNSTFIINTRNLKQKLIIPEIMEIEINLFEEKYSIKLLHKITKNKWRNNKNEIDYLKKISNYYGNLPLAITLVGNDLEYSKLNPKKYYEDLLTFGINMQFIVDDSERIKSEKTNINLLLDRAFGISNDNKSIYLSNNAKQLLGLIGCLNNANCPIVYDYDSNNTDTLKAILELENYGLIGVKDERIVYPKHVLIYNYARENANKLLTDIDILYRTMTVFYSNFSEVYDGNGAFSYEESYEALVLHLYKGIKMAIILTNNYTDDYNTIIFCGCSVLARSGLYDEFNEIKLMIDNNRLIDKNNLLYTFAYSEYLMGINDYNTLIKINEEVCEVVKNKYGEVSIEYVKCYCNLSYFYVLNKNYERSLSTSDECFKIFMNLNEYDNETELVIQTNRVEALIGLNLFDKAITLLENSIKKYNNSNNSDAILDAELALVKLCFKNNMIEDGLKVFEDCYEKRVKNYTLRDTRTLDTINTIGELCIENNYFDISKEIYKKLINEAVRFFGKDHIITKRYIKNLQLCEGRNIDMN